MILRGLTDTNFMEETNRTVQRLSVSIRMAVTTTVGLILPDLTAVQLKCTLYRNGKNKQIFQDNLKTLAIESMYFGAIEPIQNVSFLQTMNVAGGIATMICPIIIDLGSPINLKGNDKLTLEVTMSPAWLLGPALSVAVNSTMEFLWREQVGVETFTPFIRSKYVQAGISKVVEPLGNNITSLAFINTEGIPGVGLVNDTNAILQQVTISSDRYNINDTLDRCLARRQLQFQTQAAANYRGHSFFWDFSGKLNSVKFDAQLNPANVLVSRNVLVWRTYDVDNHTINRAAQMEAKHEAVNAQEIQQQAAGKV